MPQVDLNKLREQILQNQRDGKNLPDRQKDKVFVSREGDIVEGRSTDSDAGRRLSEVHQGVFASRLERDQKTVNEKLPRNAKFLHVGGVSGWLYSFYDEFCTPYQMFVYFDFDSSQYQVKVVDPAVEGKYNVHNGHLYSDGRICFGGASWPATLEQAYAKSVVWANGFTTFQKQGTFPFSINNF